MDSEMICNFRKCRKPLKTCAWVTSCSHIFCDEDGSREFRKSYSCPACETSLSGKLDIIKTDLQPSEQYKSMVLAGHKPDTIMDIASRALSFWTYQAHQERSYQEYVSTKAKERNTQIEKYYEQLLTHTQTELNNLKSQMQGNKKELENLKKQYNECQEKLMDKSRQYQKLQTMCDSLRMKMISPARFDNGDAQGHLSTPSLGRSFDMPMFTTGDDMLKTSNGSGNSNGRNTKGRTSPPSDHDFVLRPKTTPIVGTISDHDMTGPAALRHFGNTPTRDMHRNNRKPGFSRQS